MTTSTQPSREDEAVPLAQTVDVIDAMAGGEIVVLVDDEPCENEGDPVLAAQHATPEAVNVVANHRSYLDHFVVMRILRGMRPDAPRFLTKSESVRHPLGRAWATAWQGIPVDRGSPSVRTVREVRSVLRRDGVLVVYPAGTRSRQAERLGPFTSGALRFAADARVPLVPVAVAGAERVLPVGARRFRRARIDVRVGCPLLVADERPASVRADLLAVAARGWMSAALTEMSASRPERTARDRAPAGPSPSPEVLS